MHKEKSDMPYITLKNLDLHYEDTEEGEDLPLLFLHGWGTSGQVWGAQLKECREKHRVVSIDWRGRGRSDRPSTENDLDGVVEDIAELIQRLDLDGAVVIGSSIGAIFATELALRHPEVVTGVVSVDGTAYWASENMDLEMLKGELTKNRPAFLAEWVPNWFSPCTAPL
jgi:non-heme chloroperoxidase